MHDIFGGAKRIRRKCALDASVIAKHASLLAK